MVSYSRQVILVAALSLVASGQSLRAADESEGSANWTIEIVPAERVPATSDGVVVRRVSDDADSGAVTTADYNRIYDAIPFRRAEYNANPSYRHDSAMEILTGNARHQTVVVHDSDRIPEGMPSARRASVPYRYNNPAWGLQYEFYFPYWNYRGLY